MGAIKHMCTHFILVLPEFNIAMLPETPYNSHHLMAQISSKTLNEGKYSIFHQTIGRDYMRNDLPKTSQVPNLHNKRTGEKTMGKVLHRVIITNIRNRELNSFILQSNSHTTHAPN